MQARGWIDLVVRRTVADGALTMSAVLVVLATTTTLVAAGIYPATAARQGAIRALAAADPSNATIVVTFDATPADAPATDDKVTRGLDQALGSIAGTVIVSGRSESYARVADAADAPLAVFGFVDGLTGHARLMRGTWPVGGGAETQAVVTQSAADRLGVDVGVLVQMASRLDARRRVAVRITGIIAPVDRHDPAWAGDPLALDGATEAGPFVTLGPLFVTRSDLLARTIVTRATLRWVAIPDFNGLDTEELPGLVASTADIRGLLAVAIGPDRAIDVQTGLPALLAGVGARVTQAGSGTAVTAAQLLVLAVYALVLVAALLLERRRPGITMLVARGAGTGQLVLLVTLEGMLLVVPSAALGVPLGLWVVSVMTGGTAAAPGATAAFTGGPGGIALVAAGTAVMAILGFLAPTLVSIGPLADLRRSARRVQAGAIVTRGGIDVALLALAALGVWQLRAGASPGGVTRPIGPLDIAAPAMALVAGAALSLRVTPAIARGVEAIGARGTGAAGALGGRSIGRRAGASARPVLLLVAAAGIALFSVAFGRTWASSQRDQVAHAVAGDVAGSVPADSVGDRSRARQAYLTMAGVTRASPVLATTIDAGTRRSHLLAVAADPALAAAALRDDLSTSPVPELLAGLVAKRPALPFVALPAGTSRVRVAVDASLLAVQDGRLDASGRPGLSGALVVEEADGTLLRLDGAPARPTGGAGPATLEVPLVATATSIVAVELTARPVDGRPIAGTIGISGLETSRAVNGDDAWLAMDVGAGTTDWGFTRQSFGSGPEPMDRDPARPGWAMVPITNPLTGPGAIALVFRPTAMASLAGTPMAALADQVTLDGERASAGATITIGVGLDTRRLGIAGTVSSFPGVDGPGIAVVDLGTWQLGQYGATGVVAAPTAWWLATDGTDDAAIATGLTDGPDPLIDVRARAAAVRERLEDPVAMSILGTFGLVAVAALAFAVLGSIAASWTAGRARRGEIAALLALGLSRRQLVTLVVAEEAFPVVVGLVGGTALGLTLGALVLPPMARAIDGTSPVPPAILVVPLDLVLALVVGGLVVVVVAAAAQLRAISRVSPADALRRDAVGGES